MANKLITLELLTQYNTGIMSTIDTKVSAAVSALGDVFRIKGRKDSVDDLASIDDAKVGDVWLVGSEGASEFEEYYYVNTKWEFMGTTAPSLAGYVTETDLYKGTDGDGTVTAPAAGTILGSFKTLIDANTNAIEAINNVDTGILANAKKYTDDEAAKVKATADANTEAITAINDSSTGIAATAKTYTDTKVKETDDKVTVLQTNVGGLGECTFASTDEVKALTPVVSA